MRRRSASTAAAYPHAVELLILAIRCGYLPRQAMAVVADRVDPAIGAAFRCVVANSERSTRFADALATLIDDIGPTATPLVDTLSAADRYGLALGPTLDRLAADARDQQRRDAEARVRQLPVRLSAPMVLCTLPSFVFLAIAPLLIGALSSLRR
ncbi:MAG TPA: type II secretion system F family protein [Ilumatobacteraceae bacterium]|nr:type II secretion system F family protein [Ilumatobacteraceae bacterium]